MSTPTAGDLDYAREIATDAPTERVFDSLTTLDGLRGWWTPIVSGSPTTGGEITFGFSGMDEHIVMRVDQATRHSKVIWTCLTHSGHPEWQATTIAFELERTPNGANLLRFRHIGLIPRLNCYETCGTSWEHFLQSLLDYAQHGKGSPF
jgi:uncharacterized protein YndB with AHSA1/START domain